MSQGLVTRDKGQGRTIPSEFCGSAVRYPVRDKLSVEKAGKESQIKVSPTQIHFHTFSF